ncbi:uncharacterized protein [Diabrotica undecimpunctata]|uniref:uncharacterized protein n=1 Tax=Diabrotica undecimpunctata TaxID=50387 RepID=UPI003B64299F
MGSREWLEQFINLYYSEPCLWNTKDKNYFNRDLKRSAYSKLIEHLKLVDSNANKAGVIKKINNIRSTYKKERTKVANSKKSGAGTDEVYVPKLWYFSMLLFLDEQDVARHSRSNMDNDSTDNEEMEGESPAGTQSTTPSPTQANAQMFEEEQSQATQSQAPLQSTEQPISNSATQSTSTERTSFKRKRSKTTENEKLTTEVLQTVQNHFKKPTATNDRFDIFGANVAAKLRDLTKHQRILAQKNYK